MQYKDLILLIKNKRISLNLNQKEFAKMIPMKQSKYNKIENLKLEPSFDELQLILSSLSLKLIIEKDIEKKPIWHSFD